MQVPNICQYVHELSSITCIITHLNLPPNAQYSILLYSDIREFYSMYRPIILFVENHQLFQGWNPATTMEIKILKIRFKDLQIYNEKITNNYLP